MVSTVSVEQRFDSLQSSMVQNCARVVRLRFQRLRFTKRNLVVRVNIEMFKASHLLMVH